MSKDRSAGELVDKGDLWECLFGHVARARDAEANNGGGASSSSGDGRGNSRHQSDARFHDKAVMSYLAGEAAEQRRP